MSVIIVRLLSFVSLANRSEVAGFLPRPKLVQMPLVNEHPPEVQIGKELPSEANLVRSLNSCSLYVIVRGPVDVTLSVGLLKLSFCVARM